MFAASGFGAAAVAAPAVYESVLLDWSTPARRSTISVTPVEPRNPRRAGNLGDAKDGGTFSGTRFRRQFQTDPPSESGDLDSFSARCTFNSCRDEGSAPREIHNREKHGAASDIAPAIMWPGLHFFRRRRSRASAILRRSIGRRPCSPRRAAERNSVNHCSGS